MSASFFRVIFLVLLGTAAVGLPASAQPANMPQDMRMQQTGPAEAVQVEDPVQAPAAANSPNPVTVNVGGGNATTTNFSKERSDYLRDNQTSIQSGQPTTTAPTNLGPNSAYSPVYVSPCNQTFDCPQSNRAATQPSSSTTSQPAATTNSTATTSAPATPSPVATSSQTGGLAGFGITRQDAAAIRTASFSPASVPTSTDVWNAPGKPMNFVDPPMIDTTVANTTPRVSRVPQYYAPQYDQSNQVAQELFIALLGGVVQGLASSSGSGYGGYWGYGGGGVYRGGRVGGPCDYWTSNVGACRAVRR